MKPKKRISTLWFTLPILGFLIPPIGMIVRCVYMFLAIVFIVTFFELLLQVALTKQEADTCPDRS